MPFELFGHEQEVNFGYSNSYLDANGLVSYAVLIPSPYPDLGLPSDFDASDPAYAEPADTLPSLNYPVSETYTRGAYLNLYLTPIERWHLAVGFRWSRYEYNNQIQILCTDASSFICTYYGAGLGEPWSHSRNIYPTESSAWPPSVTLSYDVTDDMAIHLGYTDIYSSNAQYQTFGGGPVEPTTGFTGELGWKWAPYDGRLNFAAAAYYTRRENFLMYDEDNYRSPSEPGAACCYVSTGTDYRTENSQGIDLEASGEVMPGLQISASYAFNQNKTEGEYYELYSPDNVGQPLVTRSPEHLLKLWASYDFAESPWADREWVSRLTVSGGLNWQSRSYYSGSTCTEYEQEFDTDGNPVYSDLGTEVFNCATYVDYDFEQDPYAVLRARIGYELNENWDVALNVENLTDQTYYQTIGTAAGGNWYGEPINYTLSLKGRW